MADKIWEKASLAALAAGTVAGEAHGAEKSACKTLLAKIRSDNADVRTKAWQSAGEVGAIALKGLAKLVTDGELEVGRAAKRAMWKIVRHVGNPGSASSKKNRVVAALIKLLDDQQPAPVRREVLWMLSEIAGDEAVSPIAALLSNAALREDARMVLDRIPGEKSLASLSAGLKAAPDDFKPNIAQSLRHRGVEVPGIPCRKLVPTKKTSVKPA